MPLVEKYNDTNRNFQTGAGATLWFVQETQRFAIDSRLTGVSGSLRGLSGAGLSGAGLSRAAARALRSGYPGNSISPFRVRRSRLRRLIPWYALRFVSSV
jgi:hypothetical protein